ncbi:hypothetical protein IHE45_19G091500 [Dioscorea alata]|uniref:Uncharacterized protein n=1 Tax=Dioscorea alata TaxID=55571 RepID=A0ACB7TZZ8_DIOAL|nr:hypothetical protein IHE45_19G091500 [Dioscorea alata]
MSSLMESLPQPSPEQSQLAFSPALAPPPPPPPSQPSHGGSPSIVKSSPPPSPKIIKPIAMISQAPIPEHEYPSLCWLLNLRPSPHTTAPVLIHITTTSSPRMMKNHTITTMKQSSSTQRKKVTQCGGLYITIKGDNMGAFMDLASQNKKQSNNNNNNMLKQKVSNDKPMTALVNNNVQAINNSMVLNNVFAHKNPSVHLNLSNRHRSMSFDNIHLLKA